ncbi:At2g28390/T1B3.9, related [Eimeria maxima]|uniref:At2g28390/T1B3.9, related n=1 Tax=Eimeria maxima TaxID=5804 RepID=U6M6K9_EIMMA|nr:At2g28390/T1B3.9, related [Eimeria maxima]CDJ58074.1 At2g28390/T1B3.9, related [Eimeria maxima]
MAQRQQDKLEAVAEAAGAAAAAAAASVWRFFEDDAATHEEEIKKISASCGCNTQKSTAKKQQSPPLDTVAATAAKLTPATEITATPGTDTSTPFVTAPAYGSNGNCRSSNNSSGDSSTTATSKDTSPMGPRGNIDDLNAPAGCNNSSRKSADIDGISDSSAPIGRTKSSVRCNDCSGSSSNGGDFVSALGMLRNAANCILSGTPQNQQQTHLGQQQLLMQEKTGPHSGENLQLSSSIAIGSSIGSTQAPGAAAAAAPGAAAAAAVVAAAVLAAEAAVRGDSSSVLSSTSACSNGISNTTHYQTSTTPEAVQVAHRLLPQQQQQDHQQQGNDDLSVDTSTANAAPDVAAEVSVSACAVSVEAEVNAATLEGGTPAAAAANETETTGGAGIHKLVESRLGYATDIGGQLQQTAQQTAAKKHPEEDASTPSWYRHKRHTFIFSYSGKPVYSRYGKEENLGAFAGALLAIVSKLERFRGDKPPDVVRHFRCFGGRFVFLPRGPFYLALFDRQSVNNSIARAYLMLLHRQLVCILTKEVERTLLIRPSFDVRPLMGGTDGIFRGLHRHYFNSMLSVLLPILMESNCAAAASGAPAGTGAAASVAAEQLHKQQQQQEQQSAALSISGAFEALPLSSTMRHIATTAVKNGPTPNVLASMLLAEQRVVSLSYAKGYELSPTDVCLLTNFVSSSLALRQLESFTPLCLPSINDRQVVLFLLRGCLWGFLHAYVRYLTPRLAFVCLSSPADSIRFHQLANHCNKLFAVHLEYGPGDADEYRLLGRNRNIAGVRPVCTAIYTLYTGAVELIQNAKRPAHSFVETTDEKVYVWLTVEFFFFCCVPRWINISTTLVEQLAKWIREQQPFLFITETPPLVHIPQQK